MKLFSSVCWSTISVFFAIIICAGCSELPESSLAQPDSLSQADDPYLRVLAQPGFDKDIPTIAEIPENTSKLKLKIIVSECDNSSSNRAFELMVVNPKSATTDFYDDPRYQIRWYSRDGRTISESLKLECVAGGVYYVEIIDRPTSAMGRSKVRL